MRALAPAATASAAKPQTRVPATAAPAWASGHLTLGLIAAAVIPVAGFGLVVLLLAGLEPETDDALARGLLIAIVISVVLAVVLAGLLAANPAGSLRALTRSMELVSAGDPSAGLDSGCPGPPGSFPVVCFFPVRITGT